MSIMSWYHESDSNNSSTPKPKDLRDLEHPKARGPNVTSCSEGTIKGLRISKSRIGRSI